MSTTRAAATEAASPTLDDKSSQQHELVSYRCDREVSESDEDKDDDFAFIQDTFGTPTTKIETMDENTPRSSKKEGKDLNDEATAHRLRRNAKISAFFSYLLFVLGTILYLVLAVEDYQWTKMVQYWPEYILLSRDDYISYDNYRLCLLYYGTEEAVEAAKCGGTTIADIRRRRMVEVGYYDEYGWEELPIEVQSAFVTLGYTADMYDDPLGIGLKASSDGYIWDDLTSKQQEAAMLIGYDQVLWDEPGTGSDDSYNSLDDDSLIITESGWWIGISSVLWFSASFCFVLVGFLDLFREKHYFHTLMILAGLTGCVGALFLENNNHISVIFDTISSHLFFLEAIKMMFFEEEMLDEGAANWMCRLVVSADIMFLIGAITDLIISYVWLFDDTIDWSMPFAIIFVLASVLWLTCSLIYMGAFIYFPQEGLYNPTLHSKWTWSVGGVRIAIIDDTEEDISPKMEESRRSSRRLSSSLEANISTEKLERRLSSRRLSSTLVLATEVVGFDEITMRPPKLRRLSSNGSLTAIKREILLENRAQDSRTLTRRVTN